MDKGLSKTSIYLEIVSEHAVVLLIGMYIVNKTEAVCTDELVKFE